MYDHHCVRCGIRFYANSMRRKLCDDCREGRDRHPNRLKEKYFIGVDGEGVTRPDGSHEYILLSVGGKSLYKPDGSRLTWYDIMPFLWECFLEDPEACYVGFYLGYDFTQWLRDLPENRANTLLTNEGITSRKRKSSGNNPVPFPVEHREWEFDMLGMRRYKLRQVGAKAHMYICDAGAYFQTSFLNAIDPDKWPDGAVLSDEEYSIIKEGKAERGNEVVPWGTPVSPDMIHYNIIENRVLARLMESYNQGLETVGISLKRDQWFGPGQAAQAWMGNINAPNRNDFEAVTPIRIRNALRSTYYGGWFEIFAHGYIPGTSHAYDINSAYPDIQSRLPCILHGTWDSGSGPTAIIDCKPNLAASTFTAIYGTVRGSQRTIGAAPHRLTSGNILRPQVTKGWYWAHELYAAQSAGLIDTIDIEEWVQYTPCDCPPPFRDERTLYLDRIRVGKDTISGKARKLVYNSAYGKTAQSIGVAKYANPFYASLITSFCRTAILRAISMHPFGPDDVLMVATDGVVFRKPNRKLEISQTELGSWSHSLHENLTLFMPGVYWDDTTRQKLLDGKHPTLKSRGISARTLANHIDEIDRYFRDSAHSGRGWPKFDLPVTFSLVTPKLALARGKWHTCGAVVNDAKRTIDADPYRKRNPVVEMRDGIWRSFCYESVEGSIESTPYKNMFGDSELMELVLMDGAMEMLMSQAILEV